MGQSISASRTVSLLGRFDRNPAYAGLADALTLLIGDGRIPQGVRLPSERELTEALGVSRTTVTRAYAALRDAGFAEARQGAGTFTRVPAHAARAHDRALFPHDAPGVIDLNCSAASAPPGLMAAYLDASAELPAYLSGHGYFPAGLPRLQRAIAASYDARGLPTDPDQIMVTAGALSATVVVAHALLRPGDRVAVETPVYPNATRALTGAGARLLPSPVDPDGWDLDAVGALLRQQRPSLAYLIPDFQNPTGNVMTDAQRARYAALISASGTVPVVDEAHQALALDGQAMPLPFAVHAPGAITLGSASKAFWGGLRLGWIRAPLDRMEELTRARVSLDLGAPVLEQLVLARLLEQGPVLREHVDRLRVQRNALVAALGTHLPSWRFVVPTGGLALWCQLPSARATALSIEAERRGVVVPPGPIFAVEGGLDRFVRVPWTRSAEELTEVSLRLAQAWSTVGSQDPRPAVGRPRVMVA